MNLYILIGVIVVSPVWGILSTQLFLQSWLAFINAVIYIIGVIRNKVARKNNLLGLGVAILQVLLFSGLLSLGYYLLGKVFSFGYTRIENIIYWIFAIISLLYMVPQMPSKIKKAWRSANVSGALEENIAKRKLEDLIELDTNISEKKSER